MGTVPFKNNGRTKAALSAKCWRAAFFYFRCCIIAEESTPNLSYRLTPVDAFRQKLVNQIEVIGISQLGDLNVPLLRLVAVSRNSITAKLKVYSLKDGQTSEQEVTIKQGDDLFKKTHRKEYQGLIVNEIKIGKWGENDNVEFANGLKVSFSDEVVGSKADVFRAQIEKPIETHMIRQSELLPLGIKVLSLFFIDRVANYTFSGMNV